jgi:hypothetical protein
MGILSFLFGSDSSNPGSKTMYDVRIKGTIQANGPRTINRLVRMDETQMRLFTGSKRYEAIEGWIRANYPGATIPNVRNFAIECKSVKE